MITRSFSTVTKRLVHGVAKSGFAGSNVDRYNKARPSYPKKSIEEVVRVLGDLTQVVELGSGTGKFTQVMAPEVPKGCRYIATEPSDEFRASLNDSGIAGVTDVLYGTGEAIPADDDSTDGVVVAQAFHWMANESTLKETARVLKPGGRLVMVWNAIDVRVPWLDELEQILDKRYYDKDIPRYITQNWRRAFDTKTALERFSSLEHWTVDTNYVQMSTQQDICDRILSVSVVAMLPQKEQDLCVQEIKDLLNTHPDTKDLEDGQYRLEYRTDVAHVQKIL